jgi:hypothetical protein
MIVFFCNHRGTSRLQIYRTNSNGTVSNQVSSPQAAAKRHEPAFYGFSKILMIGGVIEPLQDNFHPSFPLLLKTGFSWKNFYFHSTRQMDFQQNKKRLKILCFNRRIEVVIIGFCYKKRLALGGVAAQSFFLCCRYGLL